MRYTIEMLEQSSLKARLQGVRDDLQAEVDAGKTTVDEMKFVLSARRDPATVFGFLSKEKAQELIDSDTPGLLIQDSGLVLINDDQVCFLSDDGGWAHGVLPLGMSGCIFRLPLGTVYKLFKTLDEFIDHYGKHHSAPQTKLRHLNTVEELVDYLNQRYGDASSGGYSPIPSITINVRP